MEPRHPEVYVPLVGQDGNAGAIIGRTREALRRAGVPREELEAYQADAMSGDYDHVLQVTLAWVSEGFPPPPRPDVPAARCPACGSEDYYPGTVGCRACGSQAVAFPEAGEDEEL